MPFASLAGRFVPNQPVTVVPDRFWEADNGTGTWAFRGWANLVVYIDETGTSGSLQFRLVPDETTAGMHFLAKWDQKPLWKSAVKAGDEIVIEISRERLSPGVHQLTLGRINSADDIELKKNLDCRFTAIEVGSGTTWKLDAIDHRRSDLIRAFLEDGVVGESKEKFGGLLVSGPLDLRVLLTPSASAEISFMVSSFLVSETRFVVEVDGVEHEVHAGNEAVEIRVAMDEGDHEISLRADGPEEGLYLWGAPNFRLDQPNGRGPVILVTLDTTRKDALSIYGGTDLATPNIARLAETSTVFHRAWSTSPWTLPSHASIFTGLYPTRHGAGVSRTRLDTPYATLAELAHETGFRTAGFSGGALSASRWGLARGFDLYRDPDQFETKGDRLTDYVEEWIDHHGKDQFFLFVNFFDPHGMYRAPDEFEAKFGVSELRAAIAGVPVWNRVSEGDSASWRAVVNGEVEPTAGAIEYVEAAYLSEVAFMDHQIGRLISILRAHGLYDRSTIILVADHGEFLGEGGFFSHACRLDPELTEIPLLIKWPGQTTPVHDERLVSQVDLFGAILDALGVTASTRDGLPLQTSDPTIFDRRTRVYMEEHENRIHPLSKIMTISPHIFGLQQEERRQLVWDGGSLCYDRSAEGWRETDCEVDWQQRIEELAAVAALPVETDLSTGDVGLTDEMREDLVALGYIR